MVERALRILVVDGNTREYDALKVAAGGSRTGAQYIEVLERQGRAVDCTPIHPADADDPGLPPGVGLADFDGAVWTGSGLNVYNLDPPVTRQIDLARAVFAAGVPVFGSCWGLQVATVALGGSVRRNPKGREIGVARRIVCTEAGRAHPMFAAKPPVFDAIAVHFDEVETAPPGMIVLATNAVSAIQAAEIRDASGRGFFWGVQYHPEYDFREIAATMRRSAERMIADGFVRDATALDRYLDDFMALQADPGRRDLAWRHGLDATVLDPRLRHAEIRAWLESLTARA